MILELIIILIATPVSSTAKPDFLINCGLPKSTTVASFDNRVWQSDVDAAFSPTNINTISSAVDTTNTGGGQTPYTHARIFHSPITYSFRVPPGPKFLRLYFSNSSQYNNIPQSQFSLSLKANTFTLLHNFSSYLNSLPSSYHLPYLSGSIFEFYIPVPKTNEHPATLNLTFSPGNNLNPGFVNGIEITSIFDDLYINNTGTTPYDVTFPNTVYTLDNMTTSFQTVYRLNVGGTDVQAAADAGSLGRIWLEDESLIVGGFFGETVYPPQMGQGIAGVRYMREPFYVAPKQVYGTVRFIGNQQPKARLNKNLTWGFEVDSGFDYLVRLHFCEMDKGIKGSTQRVFKVLLNGLVADSGIDVWELSGGLGSPIYRDYIVHFLDVNGVADASNGTKAKLLLTLLPVADSPAKDVLLNGVEILKLNQTTGNLAAPNPPLALPPASTTPTNPTKVRKSTKHYSIAIIVGILAGAILASLITLSCLLYKRKAKGKGLLDRDKSKTSNGVPVSIVSGSTTSTAASSLPSDLCHRFSLVPIRVATSDFDENTVIGTGGFGKVYKGSIVVDGEATTVAIKRLNPESKQGAVEFRTEIEMLSRLRHLHLVSLIGYCEDRGEMILVYEYMPRGTLRDHLMYKSSDQSGTITSLSWKQRLKICVGSARGLHYLHSGTKELIIHRDVKSTNILLDDKWTAKVSDFGLSKVGPTSETGVGHVSTAVKGSIGYLDPEYFKRQRLTEKSDVYSFGVVLFEVLCARPAVDPGLPKEQVNLALWARKRYRSGALHTIVDPYLTGQIAPECLSKFGEIAEMCVCNHGSQRPSMGDVVWALEFSLQLQETAEKNNINGGLLGGLLGQGCDFNGGDGGGTDDDVFTTSGENLSHSTEDKPMWPMTGNSSSSASMGR